MLRNHPQKLSKGREPVGRARFDKLAPARTVHFRTVLTPEAAHTIPYFLAARPINGEVTDRESRAWPDLAAMHERLHGGDARRDRTALSLRQSGVQACFSGRSLQLPSFRGTSSFSSNRNTLTLEAKVLGDTGSKLLF
jgi:hypothetical protein